MEVKSKHSARGHHLPCLSGLSQAPLLPLASDHNNNNTGSERSTPVSAHFHSSPTSNGGHLAASSGCCLISGGPSGQASGKQTHITHHQLHGRQTGQTAAAAAPTTPSSATPFASPRFFFPLQPPPRQASASQQQLANNSSKTTTSNRSPKGDMVMNNNNNNHQQQHEITGNHCSSSLHSSPKFVASMSSSHQQQHLAGLMPANPAMHNQARGSSKLNSPLLPNLPAPTKPFNDPSPHSLAAAFTSLGSGGGGSNGNVNNWQQDDNYHLYHEPIDPDDESGGGGADEKQASSEPSPRAIGGGSAGAEKSPTSLDLLGPLQQRHHQHHHPTFSRSSTANNSRDWSFAVPNQANGSNTNNSQQANKSPTAVNAINGSATTRVTGHLHHHLKSISSLTTSSNNQSNEASSNGQRRKDVSADIYSAYVSLKPGERSTHRSRSYHGPKNPTTSQTAGGTNSHTISLAYHKDAAKNLSSNSVAEHASLSPAAACFASSTMIRDYDAGSLCVRELIETERNYVLALEMILTCFAKPLEPVLRREDSQFIFGHIKYFHQIHSSFQTELNKAAALRSYNKDIASLTTAFNSSTTTTPTASNLNSHQLTTSSNPTTPTLVGNNIPRMFLSSSPLPSPTVPSSPLPLTPTPTSTTTATSSSSAAANNNGTNKSSFKISSCFLNIKEKFLKYGEYCASLSKIQALLDELSNRNEAIASQLDRCQQDANEGKFKLRDLLSLPMQRILKYHLLLAQLIKNTSSQNEDYLGLKRAHETMVDLGQYINEVKRDTEAIQIINDIEQSITSLNMPPNTQLTDYGRLVTDGYIRIYKAIPDLKLKSSHDSCRLKLPHDTKTKQKDQKRYVFVFDKVMLICKLGGVRGYQYKEALVLSEFELDANPVLTSGRHETKEKWSYGFNLVRHHDDTVYSFYAKTLENKNKWIESIEKAMDNIRPTVCRNNETNHEFLMHTFDKASSCDHCGKLLLGLYYQGYRCRTCFTSAHKKCLALIRPCGPALPPKIAPPPSSSAASHMVELLSDQTSKITIEQNHDGGMREEKAADVPELLVLNNSNNSNNTSYVNFILTDYDWFSGRMERDTAQALLTNCRHETFLVRVSPKHNGSYVISLNYNGQVKHMRIHVSKDNLLYLSQNRYFKSIIELVSWYERNSLQESFHMLEAHLKYPYKVQAAANH